MDNNRPYLLSSLWQYSNPPMILAGILTYALGAGVANYLGFVIHWGGYWTGQGCVTFLQVSSYLLKLYFELPERSVEADNDRSSLDDDQPRHQILTRARLLPLIYCLLTVGAMLTVLLFANGHNNLLIVMVLGIGFSIGFFYGVPPLKLVYTGYGELSQAILIANILPALALNIQAGQLHRLLAMVTFPLTFLYIAMVLAMSLVTYAGDLKHNRKTLMVRLGWQYGMSLHHLLILLAYLILFMAYFLGLPWSLTWPGMLTIPVAVFQVLQLNRIAGGEKPHWKLLEYTALSTFIFSAYFLTLALWTK